MNFIDTQIKHHDSPAFPGIKHHVQEKYINRTLVYTVKFWIKEIFLEKSSEGNLFEGAS